VLGLVGVATYGVLFQDYGRNSLAILAAAISILDWIPYEWIREEAFFIMDGDGDFDEFVNLKNWLEAAFYAIEIASLGALVYLFFLPSNIIP